MLCYAILCYAMPCYAMESDSTSHMIGHKNNRTKGTNNAPIPEDNEQYCFRMPLKLEAHKRYCCTHVMLCYVMLCYAVTS